MKVEAVISTLNGLISKSGCKYTRKGQTWAVSPITLTSAARGLRITHRDDMMYHHKDPRLVQTIPTDQQLYLICNQYDLNPYYCWQNEYTKNSFVSPDSKLNLDIVVRDNDFKNNIVYLVPDRYIRRKLEPLSYDT